MEIYKRQVTYEDLNYRVIDTTLPITASSYLITATTLYFPFMLTQDLKDIGIYTDTENPVYEIVDFSGVWNLTNNGVGQGPCLVLNNCSVSFTSTPITYYNANNGSISALVTGCPGPQTVQWSGPNGFNSTNLNINGLSSGSYTVKVTDSNCNITYGNYFLTQPQSLSFSLQSTSSQTNATTPGGCDGSASIVAQGGLPPYTYLWYSGNPSNVIAGPSMTTTGVTGLCAGTYNVQIIDSATPSTMVSGIFTISEPTPISGSVVTTTNVTCNGSNDGSIKFVAIGGITPYQFILSGPTPGVVTGSTSSAVFNNLLAGSYTCTIYDSVGNLTSVTSNLTSPSIVLPNVITTNISCYGAANGVISISPSGGVVPYSVYVKGTSLINPSTTIYTNNFVNNTLITNLNPGNYDIIVKDSNSCPTSPTTYSVTLKQKPKLNINRLGTLPSFNGYNLPCFSATTGVTFQTTYSTDATTTTPTSQNIDYYLNGNLMPPSPIGVITTKTFTLGAGTHTITAVNSVDNCSATTVVTLTQPPMALSFVGDYVITNGPGAAYTTSIDTVGAGSVCTPLCSSGGGYGGTCIQGIVNVDGGVAPYTVTWNMLPTILSTTGPAWGVGITSDPFCSTNPNYGIQATVVDANGCTITSVLKFPRTLP